MKLKRDAVVLVLPAFALVLLSTYLTSWSKLVTPGIFSLAQLLGRATVHFESGILFVLL